MGKNSCRPYLTLPQLHLTLSSPYGTHSPEPLQWRHNEHDGVSNHRRLDCSLNRLFRRRSKKTSKLRITGLCEGNQPVTGGFPPQRVSNAENISIWWRHHDNSSTKALLRQLLTNNQWDPMAFTCKHIYLSRMLENCYFTITATIPRGQWGMADMISNKHDQYSKVLWSEGFFMLSPQPIVCLYVSPDCLCTVDR